MVVVRGKSREAVREERVKLRREPFNRHAAKRLSSCPVLCPRQLTVTPG